MRPSAQAWIGHARLRLRVAQSLLDQEYNGLALAQLYFAVFAAGKALLAAHRVVARTHHGVHDDLYRLLGNRVHTRLLSRLRQERESYDYQLEEPGGAHVERRLAEAEQFIEQAETLAA